MGKKVDLMGQWTKSTDELKNEGLTLALEELRNNGDAYISDKKNAWNRSKTALKSAQMTSAKTGNFAAIVDAEIKVELAEAEYDKATAVYNKYFEDEE